MTKPPANLFFGKPKKGGPIHGPSFFHIGKIIARSHFFLLISLILASVFPLSGVQNTRIVEKLIPVVEDFSFEEKKDPNYFFNSPSQIEIAGDNVFVLDTYNNRIQIFDLKGNYLKTIGRKGKGPLEFFDPEGFCIDGKNKKIYVCDTRNLRIQVCRLDGELISTFKLTFAPRRIVAKENLLYVLAFVSTPLILKKEPCIKKVTPEGKITGGFFEPVETDDLTLDLVVNSLFMKSDRQGNIVCAHQFVLNKIQVFDQSEKVISQFEVIYKAAAIAKTGFGYSVRNDADIQKIAYLVADGAFDSKNGYYFLSGTNGRLPDGQLEKGREIYKYSSRGEYLGTIVLPVSGLLLAFDSKDGLYLIDRNLILRKFRLAGGN